MIAIPISISLSVVSVLPGASVSDLFLAGIIPGILAKFTNKVVLLFVINLFLLAVGMVMDTTPAILIPTPIMNIAKQAMPMIIYFLIALLVITFVPALSLALL